MLLWFCNLRPKRSLRSRPERMLVKKKVPPQVIRSSTIIGVADLGDSLCVKSCLFYAHFIEEGRNKKKGF